MLSLTGKFVFSVLMALTQFIEPYTPEEIERIKEHYQERDIVLEDWMLKALEFRPNDVYELIALQADDEYLANYLRSGCIRIISATQPIRSQERGQLLTIDFDELILPLVDDEQIQNLQSRILEEEQDILLKDSLNYLKRACDLKYSVDSLAKIAMYEEGVFAPESMGYQTVDQVVANIPYRGALAEAIGYYYETIVELPELGSIGDLPKLPELSTVTDGEGVAIGEYSLTEYSGEFQSIIRRNNRIITKSPSEIPDIIKQALVSVEDSDFYLHNGVDFKGIFRAAQSTGSGQSVQGASTITMQLAKNLILYEEVFREHVSNRRSLKRKLQEYILTKELESLLTKDEILAWYLNTIDFGRDAQGIVMAARAYFGKDLDELNVVEAAFLAGLPKSPYGLDPATNMERALDRRNRVLRDMLRAEHITREEYQEYVELPIEALDRVNRNSIYNGYNMHYVNAVQRQVRDWARNNDKFPYRGFEIQTPINKTYQRWAVETLQRGLLSYERQRTRNGKKVLTVKPREDQLPNIRSQVDELASELEASPIEVYPQVLAEIEIRYPDANQFRLGVILGEDSIGLDDGTQVNRQPEDRSGNLYKEVAGEKRNLEVWDVVMLEPFPKSDGGTYFKIASYTDVQGGITVIDNATGAVLATAGGFSVGAGGRYNGAGQNRSFTSFRQPGSTVKPFTYLYAMNAGISPSRVLPNRNVTLPAIAQGSYNRCNRWNVSASGEAAQYTLRSGLERSRNRLTVNAFLAASGVGSSDNPLNYERPLEEGLSELTRTMQSFGLYTEEDEYCYPIILGAQETNVVSMAGAYATIARGGGYINPYTVSAITRSQSGASMQFPFRMLSDSNQAVAESITQRPVNMFRLRTMLQGVLARGTGRSISEWSEVIGGKTGTTTGNKDAWFVGFNKDITVAVWVGYPDGTSLGGSFEGSRAALPIFKDFMNLYYEAHPEKLNNTWDDNDVPGGLQLVRIESQTGFAIDSTFRSDFEHYTGRSASIMQVVEEYMTTDEARNVPRYYGRSRTAGVYFFNNLSSSYRSSYQSEYNSRNSSEARERWEYYRVRCDTWRSQGYSEQRYPEVREACNYVRNNPEPSRTNVSFLQFYLNKLGFVN